MLTVHHLGVSQSERIVWLCEELGIPYGLKVYPRDSETRLAPADYKALHPTGMAPVITDGDVVLAESGAIIEYILALHGKGRLVVAPGNPAFADYLFWLHFANGTLMPSEMSNWITGSIPGSDQMWLTAIMKGRADQAYGLVEKRLTSATYLAGEEFTVADIMTVFILSTFRAFTGRTIGEFPNMRRYLALIGSRPAYQRAMAKGDPGMALLLD
jgi:glutathione S-transferase